jgi:carboxylate-amine ligase
MEEYGAAARLGGLAFGMHVHVGVSGAERAIALSDALRSYLPTLAALAGNAPCLGGADTGFWSVRPKLAELFPRQGVPPVLSTPAGYAALLRWGRPSGAIPDERRLWWEVRPHPAYGTVEVRVPDQPTRVGHTGSLVAVVHALAAMLLHRLDRDGALPTHESVRIEENRWRALRHGLDGTLLDLRSGEPCPTRGHVAALLEEIGPYAVGHSGRALLADARELLACNGTERQRAVLAARGVHGLTRWLVEETRAGVEPTG